MNKITKYVLYFIITVLCGAILYFTYESPTDSVRRIYKNTDFFGTVDAKYLDTIGKMQPMVLLSSNRREYIRNEGIYIKIDIGDTLYKKSGSMKYYHIKNGDTIIFYQKDNGKDVKDK